MSQPWRPILATLVCLMGCGIVGADVRVEFPLGDYYRPGRYVPVRIIAAVEEAPGRAAARISSEGAVPTVLPLRDGRADAVVPWLVMRAPLDVAFVTVWPHRAPIEQRAPRRPLGASERLVGHTTDAVHMAPRLFPGQSIIPVPLDPVDPLPGHPAAWEALDALLLDRPSYQRLRGDAAPVLLSAGTVLVVSSREAPDELWPWVRFDDDQWVLRLEPAGPRAAGFDERSYQPAHAWRAGWPAPFRRQVLLLGVLAGCLAGAAALWRSRWGPAGVIVASIFCIIGFAAWRSVQMPVPHIRGDVLVQHESMIQRDAWHYQAALHATEAAFAWEGLTRPMLAGSWHLERMQVTLRCEPEGDPVAFVYHLPRTMRIAFLTRGIEIETLDAEPQRPVTSPIERIVRTMYLAAGDELLGQIDEARPHWPTVVLRRPPPSF